MACFTVVFNIGFAPAKNPKNPEKILIILIQDHEKLIPKTYFNKNDTR